MKYILALDQGTTSSRAILFDKAGGIIAVAQQEFTQHFPQPAWVEHDANEIWDSQLEVIIQVMQEAKLKASDIAAIGITNQRETTVVWDRKTGEPVCNAIVWQDRRTAERCTKLKKDGWEEKITSRTGLVVDPYFSGTKIEWILNHVEGAREKSDAGELAFGTIDSWLVYKLSNGQSHITDATNASRTMLFDIHKQEWDQEILTELSIPPSMLPEVTDCSGELAAVQGIDLIEGCIIGGIAGDQHAALFGQCCFAEGEMKNTYGTGCFMLMNTGARAYESQNGLLTTVASRLNGKVDYALEGSVFVGGAVVQWLRDGLELVQSSSEIEALASEVDDTDDVYFVPAFTGLGAPYWDPAARGLIIGLTRGTSRAHIALAALESIAFQSAELALAMAADAGVEIKELKVDGGATANNLLMQIQADLVDAAIIRPKVTETTALGAAYLAGLGVGFWESLEEIKKNWSVDQVFSPNLDGAQRSDKLNRWRKAVLRASDWA